MKKEEIITERLFFKVFALMIICQKPVLLTLLKFVPICNIFTPFNNFQSEMILIPFFCFRLPEMVTTINEYR